MGLAVTVVVGFLAIIFPLRYGVTTIGIPPDATKTMGTP